MDEYIFTDEQWQSVHQCFSRWNDEGIFENIFAEISKAADTNEISVDSTFIKTGCVGMLQFGLTELIQLTKLSKISKPNVRLYAFRQKPI